MRLRGVSCAILAIILVMLWGCGGGGSEGAGRRVAPAGTTGLAQNAPGSDPVIRVVNILGRPVPDPSREIKGYIVFRGEGAWINTDDPDAIVHVSGDPHFAAWDDDMTSRAGIVAQKQWDYIGRNGQQAQASYTITYNHRPLQPGHTYFYRLRRIVSPYEPQVPTAQVLSLRRPAHSSQAGTWPAATWQFQPNMDAVLSGASDPIGPVTYVLPAIPSFPRDGSATVNPREIAFEWRLQTPPTAGAGARNARYVLLVYREGASQPIFVSQPLRPTSTVMTLTVRDPEGHVFKPDTAYVWVVGHYVEGEARPLTATGFVLSRRSYFRTVAAPPSP